MISAPAELKNKLSDFKLGTLRVNFIAALEMIKRYWVLLLAFAILAVLVYHLAEEKRTLVFSVVLAFGGICANFVHIFAGYYPERCAAFSVILFAVYNHLIVFLLVRNTHSRRVFSKNAYPKARIELYNLF